jgi:H+/Cl- antiporter ClcA
MGRSNGLACIHSCVDISFLMVSFIFYQGASNVQLPYAQSPGLIPLDMPMTMWQSYFVGVMKLLSIGFTVACGWPGGIFFPLFMAAASLGVIIRHTCGNCKDS